MRIGLFSDVHGNLPALEAVLEALERERVDRLVCLGDICFGPQAHECLERVAALGCPVVLGNWDSWSTEGFPPAEDPINAKLFEIATFWAEGLSASDRAFVARFERTVEVELDETRTMLCFHGSPRSFSDWIFATTPDEDVEAMLDGTGDATLLVGGHTHLQLLRRLEGSLLLNPGSVGQPFRRWWPHEIRVAHWAEYGVIEATDGRVDIDLRRVPYDVGRLLRVIEGSGVPHEQWWLDSWEPDLVRNR